MKTNRLSSLLILAGIFLGSVSFSHSQMVKEEIDYYQSIFGMEKKMAVAAFLDIETSSPFWELYDEYETKRKELGKDRLKLLEQYAQNYQNMSDEQYDNLIKQSISMRSSTDKLLDTYYKKIKKQFGSKTAAQFFQFEGYVISEIRSEILGGVPFVGSN